MKKVLLGIVLALSLNAFSGQILNKNLITVYLE